MIVGQRRPPGSPYVPVRVAAPCRTTEAPPRTRAGGSTSAATLEKRVYLGNLAHGMTDADLKALASLIGAPDKVFIIRDSKGNPRGTGFIQFTVSGGGGVPALDIVRVRGGDWGEGVQVLSPGISPHHLHAHAHTPPLVRRHRTPAWRSARWRCCITRSLAASTSRSDG